MKTLYTRAEENWLAENYHAGTINDTLDAFEREFGRRPSKQALFVKCNKMGLHKDRHDEERHVPAQKIMRWSSPEFEREREWMLANDTNESVYSTIEAFEKEFGIRLNRTQVSLFRSTYGTQKRKAHGGGKPALPVGSMREDKDGLILVKVREWPEVPQSKDNWRFLHHVKWEEANGRPVPEGHMILFANHDRKDFSPENLVAVPRRFAGQLNNPELPKYHDRESLLACMALCDLRSKTKDIEMEHRVCAVCGREFAATAKQRRTLTKLPQTCPACLRAGKKAPGNRGDGQIVACIVCGNTFPRTTRVNRRCPECIAAHPKWSPKLHAEYFRKTGHR